MHFHGFSLLILGHAPPGRPSRRRSC
uniref:Uncharacterized protein n=1 Tax=Anguilla anguilla TaxID=7936 RepID=A0A0E9US57_ANGAN